MTEVTLDELVRRLGDVAVLDVRTTHEFEGSLGNACDPRQGHIPGARNLDVHHMIELSADQIASEVGVPPGGELVVYCHSGSRSAYAVQILRSLGYDARNYVGSWHEWSRRDELPIESSDADA